LDVEVVKRNDMGMFDNVILDVSVLPDLSDEERSLLKNDNWQTKDFENVLTDIYITEDENIKFKHSFIEKQFPYKLQIKESDWEETPVDEKPFPNAEENSLEHLFGSMRETNIRIVDLDYTGEFRFYTKNVSWYEYKAIADKGKIIKIERVNENLT
jgi:hypothetical protein